MLVISVLAAALASVLAGCETNQKMSFLDASLDRHGIVTPEQAREIEQSLTDKDIARLLSADIKAKLPTNLAIARVQNGYGCNLDVIGGDEIAGWEKAIDDRQAIRGVRALTHLSNLEEKPTLQTLRASAARMNCELLLVYLQSNGEVDNLNNAAALYWTFVGLWLVPGNTYEYKSVTQAILVDCRTGMILATASGEARQQTLYAAAYKDIAYDKLKGEVPAKAMADLQKNAARAISQVVADAKAAEISRNKEGK